MWLMDKNAYRNSELAEKNSAENSSQKKDMRNFRNFHAKITPLIAVFALVAFSIFIGIKLPAFAEDHAQNLNKTTVSRDDSASSDDQDAQSGSTQSVPSNQQVSPNVQDEQDEQNNGVQTPSSTQNDQNSVVTPSSVQVQDASSCTFNGGDGTDSTPYLISSASELECLSLKVNDSVNYSSYYNKSYKLTDNITLASLTWQPIGYYNDSEHKQKFAGNFDGNSKTISNLNIDSNIRSSGLFGYCGNSNTESSGTHFSIHNLTVSGKIEVSRTENSAFVGGICGYLESSSQNAGLELNHVTSQVSIDAKVASNSMVGGIVGRVEYLDGQLSSETIMSNLKNGGSITVTTPDSTTAHTFDVGGIVGKLTLPKNTSIQDSSGTASIKFTDFLNTGVIKANLQYSFSTEQRAELTTGGIIGFVKCYGKCEGGGKGQVSQDFFNGNMNFSNLKNTGKIDSKVTVASSDSDVKEVRNFTSGIIGYTYYTGHLYLDNFDNSGEVSSKVDNASDPSNLVVRHYAGGVLGNYNLESFQSFSSTGKATNLLNTGQIEATTTGSKANIGDGNTSAGGLIAYVDADTKTNSDELTNLMNTGDVSATAVNSVVAGGVIGHLDTGVWSSFVKVSSATSQIGEVKASGTNKVYSGGLVGWAETDNNDASDSSKIEISDVYNASNVQGSGTNRLFTGGIIGYAEGAGAIELKKGMNFGDIYIGDSEFADPVPSSVDAQSTAPFVGRATGGIVGRAERTGVGKIILKETLVAAKISFQNPSTGTDIAGRILGFRETQNANCDDDFAENYALYSVPVNGSIVTNPKNIANPNDKTQKTEDGESINYRDIFDANFLGFGSDNSSIWYNHGLQLTPDNWSVSELDYSQNQLPRLVFETSLSPSAGYNVLNLKYRYVDFEKSDVPHYYTGYKQLVDILPNEHIPTADTNPSVLDGSNGILTRYTDSTCTYNASTITSETSADMEFNQYFTFSYHAQGSSDSSDLVTTPCRMYPDLKLTISNSRPIDIYVTVNAYLGEELPVLNQASYYVNETTTSGLLSGDTLTGGLSYNGSCNTQKLGQFDCINSNFGVSISGSRNEGFSYDIHLHNAYLYVTLHELDADGDSAHNLSILDQFDNLTESERTWLAGYNSELVDDIQDLENTLSAKNHIDTTSHISVSGIPYYIKVLVGDAILPDSIGDFVKADVIWAKDIKLAYKYEHKTNHVDDIYSPEGDVTVSIDELNFRGNSNWQLWHKTSSSLEKLNSTRHDTGISFVTPSFSAFIVTQEADKPSPDPSPTQPIPTVEPTDPASTPSSASGTSTSTSSSKTAQTGVNASVLMILVILFLSMSVVVQKCKK
ncbi:MAG: hypothetical protein LBI63_02605 [Candidatus Ancillula sp.]|jgi:hypothetical protein|nr:hypothetical protein [Candidatus Ancillula sp.]